MRMDSSPGPAPNSLWAPGQDTTVLWTSISPSYKEPGRNKRPLKAPSGQICLVQGSLTRIFSGSDKYTIVIQDQALLFKPPPRSPLGQDTGFLWSGEAGRSISDKGRQCLLSTYFVPRAFRALSRCYQNRSPGRWVLYYHPHV